ncbi:MAG: hypothetical protein ABEI06_03025 [Halobacteriaceae archaeon]
MEVTPEVVAQQHEWMLERATHIVPLINDLRSNLGEVYNVEVEKVSATQYRSSVNTVFDNGDLAVNVAALLVLLRDLDVSYDYPGFVVDELLGRELAGIIAGNQPYRLISQATFHRADVMVNYDDQTAGLDDVDAALAAGFQTRLPGWEWTNQKSPFNIR